MDMVVADAMKVSRCPKDSCGKMTTVFLWLQSVTYCTTTKKNEFKGTSSCKSKQQTYMKRSICESITCKQMTIFRTHAATKHIEDFLHQNSFTGTRQREIYFFVSEYCNFQMLFGVPNSELRPQFLFRNIQRWNICCNMFYLPKNLTKATLCSTLFFKGSC